MSDNQAHSEPCYNQNSLFKHFLGYLGIFGDIDAYSVTFIGVELKGRGNAYPGYFENGKMCYDFEKKVVIVSNFGLNFPVKI